MNSDFNRKVRDVLSGVMISAYTQYDIYSYRSVHFVSHLGWRSFLHWGTCNVCLQLWIVIFYVISCLYSNEIRLLVVTLLMVKLTKLNFAMFIPYTLKDNVLCKCGGLMKNNRKCNQQFNKDRRKSGPICSIFFTITT